jgi:hypothetical protein
MEEKTMTIEQVEKTVDDLLPTAVEIVKKRIALVLASGAFDYQDEPIDSYTSAKILLCDALREASEQFRPFSRENRMKVKNLTHF